MRDELNVPMIRRIGAVYEMIEREIKEMGDERIDKRINKDK